MDKVEARRIADRDLKFYRRLSYEEIAENLGIPESFERTSESGKPYRIEIDFFDDDGESGNIRVCAMVSYSG